MSPHLSVRSRASRSGRHFTEQTAIVDSHLRRGDRRAVNQVRIVRKAGRLPHHPKCSDLGRVPYEADGHPSPSGLSRAAPDAVVV